MYLYFTSIMVFAEQVHFTVPGARGVSRIRVGGDTSGPIFEPLRGQTLLSR